MPDTHASPPFAAYSGSEPYLFVSYAHADSAEVFLQLAALHREGYRIWYDEGIDPGNEWPDEVAKALESAAQFLVFITANSVASPNVRNEIHFALNRKKPFLSVHLHETQLGPGLELRMGDIQAILRYRMNAASYQKKLVRGLITSIRSPHQPTTSLPADPPPASAQSTTASRPRALKPITPLGPTRVSSWDFCPNSAELIFTECRGELYNLCLETMKQHPVPGPAIGAPRHVRCGPDGRFATLRERPEYPISRDPDQICLYSHGVVVELEHPNGCGDLEFSPNGSWLVSGASVRASNDQFTIVWSLPSLNECNHVEPSISFIIDNPNVESFAFDRSESLLVTGDAYGWVQMWQISDGVECLRLYHRDEVPSVFFNKSGTLVLTASKDNTARLWGAFDGRLLATFPHDGMLSKACFAADDSLVVTAAHDGAAIWDLSGKRLVDLPHASECPGVLDIAIHPRGHLVVTGGCDDTARIWSAPDGTEVARMYHSEYAGEVYPVRFSPEGRLVATCGSASPLRFFAWESTKD